MGLPIGFHADPFHAYTYAAPAFVIPGESVRNAPTASVWPSELNATLLPNRWLDCVPTRSIPFEFQPAPSHACTRTRPAS